MHSLAKKTPLKEAKDHLNQTSTLSHEGTKTDALEDPTSVKVALEENIVEKEEQIEKLQEHIGKLNFELH